MLIYTSIYNLINFRYLNIYIYIYIKHEGFRRREIFERKRKNRSECISFKVKKSKKEEALSNLYKKEENSYMLIYTSI